MLMYGYAENIPDTSNTLVFNLASMREGYPRLVELIPPNQIGRLEGRDFDMYYADYLMSYEPAFYKMFGLVLELFQSHDIYLIINEFDWCDNLIQSLFKFIQSRYGYDGVRINNFEDYLYYKNNAIFKFNPEFGLYNFDLDKERWSMDTAMSGRLSQESNYDESVPYI